MNEKKKQEIPIPFELDDFYTTQSDRDDELKEKIELIDISLIDNFENHPFKVVDNDELKALKESIKTNGVLSPTIIREKEDGRYEMISGHRRKYASQQLGLETLPCIIKNLSNDEATIFMVDSNLQREKLLPSEKAFAYKMKYEAMKHQGTSQPQDTTLRPVVTKSRSDDLIGKENGESGRQVQRYIRLTYLVPKLLDMVDNAELDLSPSIAFRPAVELSYLNKDEQNMLAKYIERNITTPSLSQAIKLKTLSQDKKLSQDILENIMDQEKPNQILQFKIQENKLFDVLPRNIEREKVEDFVLKACSYYTKHLKQKDRER